MYVNEHFILISKTLHVKVYKNRMKIFTCSLSFCSKRQFYSGCFYKCVVPGLFLSLHTLEISFLYAAQKLIS